MKPSFRPIPRGRRLMAALAFALACVPPVLPSAMAADCGNTSVGSKPLNDLGSGTYKGKQGGLYPNAQNKRPSSHTALGLKLVKENVVPRNAEGEPDAKKGKLVFLSVGMSNTQQEFKRFMSRAKSDPLKSPRVVLVNGAEGGQDAGDVANPERYWKRYVDPRLEAAGVTAAQVGAIWLKETDGAPTLAFGQHIAKLEGDLTSIVKIAKARFPNLWVVYISSRIYGGYAVTKTSPEPYPYWDGFAVKSLIEKQITGALPVGTDAAPWLSWGPYMWADGTHARSDGLTWVCGDFAPDGTHPGRTGEEKVAGLLLDFLHKDVTARTWYRGSGQTPVAGVPTLSPSPSPTPTASPTDTGTPAPTPSDPNALAGGSTDDGPDAILLLALAPLVAILAYMVLRKRRRTSLPGTYDPQEEVR